MSKNIVSLLIIVKPRHLSNITKHVILAESLIPGSTTPTQTLPEIPTPDATNLLSETAVKELESQIGRPLDETGLIDLTALAQNTAPVTENLKLAAKGSVKGEAATPVFLWEMKEDNFDLVRLKLKLTGLQGGKQASMALKLCDYEELWEKNYDDPTIEAAWIMYEGLQMEGKI